MKNCAVAGIAAGNGIIYAVDNDSVSISNLHRQLLFREKGKYLYYKLYIIYIN